MRDNPTDIVLASPPKSPKLSIKKIRKEFQHIINCHSLENGSNTPDFILAQYLVDCLKAINKMINRREEWYGRKK
jgi:hypothetical protein